MALSGPQVRRLDERLAARSQGLTPHQYLMFLQSPSGVTDLEDLIAAVVVNKTDLFRDEVQLAAFRAQVLSPLVARNRRPLRVWSAGCATGEEVATLLVLLAEAGANSDSTVLGTDIAGDTLRRARWLAYGREQLRRVPPELRSRYFVRSGAKEALTPALRERASFQCHNLMESPYPVAPGGGGFDVIFCRNVLIYFNRPTIEAVARRLHDALDEGGYLFTGPSDPPLGGLAPLESILTEWGVLYRRPLPGATLSLPVPAAWSPSSTGVPGTATGTTSLGTTAPGLPSGSESSTRTALPGASAPSHPGGSAARTTTPAWSPPGAGGTSAQAEGTRAAGQPQASAGSVLGNTAGTGAPASRSGALPRAETPTHAPSAAAMHAARQALARGHWREAAQHLGALDSDADTAALAVRALANLDAAAAVYACTEAATRHPLVAGLRYLESLLLLGQGRAADAERAVRQALYLEPTLVVAWLILGRVLRRHGDTSGALKAWREAEQLCNALPPDAPVPHADGENASRLAEVARGERSRMEAALAAGEELS